MSWLSSFLRAVETHSLQFTVTTIQELGLLWALWMVMDPCPPPGSTSRLLPCGGWVGTAMELYCTAGLGTEQP